MIINDFGAPTAELGLGRGDYRFCEDGAVVEINYLRARYTHTVLGITEKGNLVLEVFSGDGKKNIGRTIEEIAGKMKALDCTSALLLSSGSDVRITHHRWTGTGHSVESVGRSVEAANADTSSAMLALAYAAPRQKTGGVLLEGVRPKGSFRQQGGTGRKHARRMASAA